MSIRTVLNTEAAPWLRELDGISGKALLRIKPDAVAAMSGSSETFPFTFTGRDGAAHAVFIKRYRYRSLKARLGGLFRGTLFGKSRAHFEYRFLLKMIQREVPAVLPLAFTEYRTGGLLKTAVLVTQAAEGMTTLDLRCAEPAGISRDLVRIVALATAHMHRQGIRHGGFFARNILVSNRADESNVLLLDPDRSAQASADQVSPEGVISDLADLASGFAAESDARLMLRFARHYLGKSRFDAADRAWLARIAQAAAPKRKQEGHRHAIGFAMAWIRSRMEQARAGTLTRHFLDTGEFVAALEGPLPHDDQRPSRVKTVRFEFQEATGEQAYAVTMVDGAVKVQEASQGRADLVVKAQADVWLAAVNGEPDAFSRLRRNLFIINGDTRLLGTLTRRLDEPA